MKCVIAKSAMALVLALVVLFTVIGIANVMTPQQTIDESPVALGTPEESEESAAAAPAEEKEPEDLMTLLADAEVSDKSFKKCQSCHTAEPGGPNRIGPNLANVVGADIATHDGFEYSDVLLGLEGTWTYEKLNAYLENPKGFAPGNKMAFPGLKKLSDRAAVIAYLMSVTENPPPLNESVTGAAESVTEGATEKVEEAAKAVTETVTEAVEGTAEAASEAAEGAAEAVEKAAEDAAEGAAEAVENATESVTPASGN